jgi:sigma-B regulation protein RsbU (phosphoserine phosphatase)
MRIRWKILIVLLSIALTPIMLMRWNAQRGMQKMGNDLATIARDALIHKASLELRIIVEEHSRVLRREKDLIEMALRVQVSELEKRFAGAHYPDILNSRNQVSSGKPDQPFYRPPAKRFTVMGNGRIRPLSVSYDRQSFRLPSGSPNKPSDVYKSISSMVPVYRSLASMHPDLIFWQLTVLEDGTQTVYPALATPHLPMMYDSLATQWYRQARENKRISWSLPIPDAFTRQFIMIVSAPIRAPDGNYLGATAIAVPVNALLQEDEHFQYLSDNIQSVLIRPESKSPGENPGIRIVARQRRLEDRHHHWWAALSDDWLKTDDEILLNTMAKDLQNQRTGVIEMMYEEKESLMAYGCIDEYCTALLLIVPKADMVAEAVSMENYVHTRIDEQIKITGFLLAGVIALVSLVAFLISGSITGNIRKLVAAARSIAAGNFQTRTGITAGDEMGELGRTFDQMVPALEERVKIKQALDVAMEVQQNLLPQEMPQTPGLDIAARSIYCDETGGDFYDFMDFCCRENKVVGLAVGDVTGHGISAALLMATTRAFLRSRVMQPGDITDVITDVNSLIAKDTEETHQFVTLFYLEINRRERQMTWIRAGHDPAIIYDPATDRFDELRGEGLSLGIDRTYKYTANTTNSLTARQVIVIGTDGVWEAQNPSGEMFGKKRLKDLIRRNHQAPAEKILSSIVDSITKFQAETRTVDDVTLAIVKVEEKTAAP